jgi:hypothetical protein
MHHLRDPEDIRAAVTLPVGVVSPGAFFPLRETLVTPRHASHHPFRIYFVILAICKGKRVCS